MAAISPRSQGPIDFARIADQLGIGTYGAARTRIGDLPEVLGQMPASVMAKEMTTPGETQIRAMFVSAGNPVLSVPNGEELAAAMEQLDLCVAIDLYVSDTAKHADFVLPATTFLEREDFPLPFLTLHTTPFVQMTEAVVERLIPVVRQQVAHGGLRLARLLDEAFAPDSVWLRPRERTRS